MSEYQIPNLSKQALEYVSEKAIDAALSAKKQYTEDHFLRLIQTGQGSPKTLEREAMRVAIFVGMLVEAQSQSEHDRDGTASP